VLADRHRVLAARGPLTLVAAHRATPDEHRRAYSPREAARIVRSLGMAETGALLVVPGWGWVREAELEDAVAPPRPAPALTPSQLRAQVSKTFELTIVEAGTGRALVDVPFAVVTPAGEERRVWSDAAGQIRIPDLTPGECAVESVIDDARVETSYVVQPGAAAVGGGQRRPSMNGHLVAIERHRVRAGETPETVAVAHEVPWERIAGFNWGTADPDALEAHYRDTLGCTRRGPDGRVRFDDSDAPGILLVPRSWRARLVVGPAHQLLVTPLRPLFLCLENEAHLRIPGVGFQARFADGTTRRGQLGRGGIARLDGVPEGPFTVSYPDELELLSGSLAVSVRRALGESATAPLFTLLMQSQEVVTRAAATYDRYLNDLTGEGLAADIDQVVTDPDARRPLLALCAVAGLPVEGAGGVRLAT
jgi:hypothetical protein